MQNHNGIVMLIANVFLVRCDQISIMSLIRVFTSFFVRLISCLIYDLIYKYQWDVYYQENSKMICTVIYISVSDLSILATFV